jgi:hypothetical protein
MATLRIRRSLIAGLNRQVGQILVVVNKFRETGRYRPAELPYVAGRVRESQYNQSSLSVGDADE